MSNLPSSLVPEPRTQNPDPITWPHESLFLVLQAANTPDLLCFRHPFSAEEALRHHQYQKTKTAEHLWRHKRKKKSSFLFELVLQHGMELCLTEPSLTARHVEPQPALWTGLRSVYQLRPVIGCPHRVRPSDDVRLRVGGMSQQFLVWF